MRHVPRYWRCPVTLLLSLSFITAATNEFSRAAFILPVYPGRISDCSSNLDIFTERHHRRLATTSRQLPTPTFLRNSYDNILLQDTKYLSPLTVVIPAFNECLRIEDTLRNYHAFLSTSQHWQKSSRILIVDDGSTDGTPQVVQNVADSLLLSNKEHGSVVDIACISLGFNQGKGAAIARGIRYVAESENENPQYNNTLDGKQRSLILMADADASADISSLDCMLEALEGLLVVKNERQEKNTNTGSNICWNAPAMIVGKRQCASTSLDRTILRSGFRTAVRTICGDLGVSDTQCGFKLMTLSAGLALYQDLHLQGWSHDCEVLYRAKGMKIPVAEVDVPWEDKSGSKLVTSAGGTIGASLQMLLDIAQLRFCYTVGIWSCLNGQLERQEGGLMDELM
mgnify:CR=1 FL=1